MARQILSDKVVGRKSEPKALIRESVLLAHQKRLLEKSGYYFTKLHLSLMQDLMKLSTSHYSEVRKVKKMNENFFFQI